VAGEDRVHMRVDEPGQQGTAGQVDRLGGPHRPQVRAHPGNAPAADAHARPGGQEPAAVEDGSVVEQDFGVVGSHAALIMASRY